MAEAFTRCPPEDDADRASLIEAFAAIERGALAGSWNGWASVVMPKTEEEGDDG